MGGTQCKYWLGAGAAAGMLLMARCGRDQRGVRYGFSADTIEGRERERSIGG